MAQRKTYGQFCGIARSLDHVGDRWSLLIVRELLLGDRGFAELQQSLEGISPTVLTRRLAELHDDGLVQRNDAPRRSRSVEYRLTDAGRALEPVLLELIRWGSRWMLSGPGDDLSDPRWAPLALKALLAESPSRSGHVHLDVEGVAVTVTGTRKGRRVVAGHDGAAAATVAAELPTVLAVAAGAFGFDDAGFDSAGDVELAAALLSQSS